MYKRSSPPPLSDLFIPRETLRDQVCFLPDIPFLIRPTITPPFPPSLLLWLGQFSTLNQTLSSSKATHPLLCLRCSPACKIILKPINVFILICPPLVWVAYPLLLFQTPFEPNSLSWGGPIWFLLRTLVLLLCTPPWLVPDVCAKSFPSLPHSFPAVVFK